MDGMKVLCFEIKFVGFHGCEWKRIANEGSDHKIAAIKRYREENGRHGELPTLQEAKDAVELYMHKKHIS